MLYVGRIQNVTQTMISKKEHHLSEKSQQAILQKLTDTLKHLSEKNLLHLEEDLMRLENDVKGIDSLMNESVQKVHGNTILDMNLEQGR